MPVEDLPAATICEAFARTAARVPDRVAIVGADGVEMTWAQYRARVRDVAAGLHELGLRPGETLAIMLNTRLEFHLIDLGAVLLGAVPFSIYNTAPPQDIASVLRNSEAQIAIVEDEFVGKVDVARTLAISELERIEVLGRTSGFDVEAAAAAVEPDDVLTLIYTSGTTGEPKGVEITHSNVIAIGRSIDSVIQLPEDSQLVTYLPMAHIGDRNTCHYWPILFGHTVTCCNNISNVLDVMRTVRLHFVFGMPRLFEKLRAIVEREADAATLDALRDARLRALGREAPEPDEELLADVRRQIGFDRVRHGFTGGAMTSPDLLAWLAGLNIPVGEIWGLSECTGVATLVHSSEFRIGTAGRPLPGVEVRLAEDGELEIRGPGVMHGYRKRPELSAEAITGDGWLRSGDIGEIDADGYVSVVDRKKELIIGSSGKNMAPARIEARLKEAFPLINGAVAIGDERPHNVALLSLDPDACIGFAREHGLSQSTPEQLADHPAVQQAVAAQIESANQHLSAPERIKAFKIVRTTWLPGGDELTPTMKPRRRAILAKYAAEIEALYA